MISPDTTIPKDIVQEMTIHQGINGNTVLIPNEQKGAIDGILQTDPWATTPIVTFDGMRSFFGTVGTVAIPGMDRLVIIRPVRSLRAFGLSSRDDFLQYIKQNNGFDYFHGVVNHAATSVHHQIRMFKFLETCSKTLPSGHTFATEELVAAWVAPTGDAYTATIFYDAIDKDTIYNLLLDYQCIHPYRKQRVLETLREKKLTLPQVYDIVSEVEAEVLTLLYSQQVIPADFELVFIPDRFQPSGFRPLVIDSEFFILKSQLPFELEEADLLYYLENVAHIIPQDLATLHPNK